MTTFEGADIDRLPTEVKDLGRLDAIFPTKALVRTGAGLMLLAGGVLMLACGGAAVFAYLKVPFPKDGPPAEIVLGVGAFSATLGLGLVAAALRRPRSEGDPDAFRGFLTFPSALVRSKDGRCDVFPWDEIEAVINPEKPLADFQILSRDGRKIPADRAIEGYLDLLGTVLVRVGGRLLGRARGQVASGQTVAFGPFGISRDALEHKGKRLPWNQVSELGVVREQGGHRRLRVKRRGAIWPWCYALLYGLPNEEVFFKLIDEVRPGGRYS